MNAWGPSLSRMPIARSFYCSLRMTRGLVPYSQLTPSPSFLVASASGRLLNQCRSWSSFGRRLSLFLADGNRLCASGGTVDNKNRINWRTADIFITQKSHYCSTSDCMSSTKPCSGKSSKGGESKMQKDGAPAASALGGAGGSVHIPASSFTSSSSSSTLTSLSPTIGGNSIKNELTETFLDLEILDTNLFRAHHLMGGFKSSPHVYGGQVIGQGLVAAAQTVPQEYHPHSLHSYFIKAGDKNKPILYQVSRTRDGRSFCTRQVSAIQNGIAICTIELSFHKEEPDSIQHQTAVPDVPQPEDLADAPHLIREKLKSPNLSDEDRRMLQIRLNNTPSTFDVRPVDPEAYLRTKASAPRLYLWVKSKGIIGEDWRLNHCVAAFISDSSMVGTALLPHVATGFKIGMVFSLDHNIWIHRHKFRIDEWMLYETESPIACGARAMIFGKLWARDGTLIISTAQEGLVRPKLEDQHTYWEKSSKNLAKGRSD